MVVIAPSPNTTCMVWDPDSRTLAVRLESPAWPRPVSMRCEGVAIVAAFDSIQDWLRALARDDDAPWFTWRDYRQALVRLERFVVEKEEELA